MADDMGLGKTAQTLSWLKIHPTLRPAIVVCPAVAKLHWQREAKLWIPEQPSTIIQGGSPFSLKDSNHLIIINYDILKSWVEALKTINPKVVIFDESHYLKNRKAQRTQAATELSKGVLCVIGLSGTPVINRPIEFYNIISLIRPNLFPNYWRYARRYCMAEKKQIGWKWEWDKNLGKQKRVPKYAWDVSGASNLEELHQTLIHTIMVRRMKSEVLDQLPDKIRTIIPLEIDNKDEYDYAEENFSEWLSATHDVEHSKPAEALVKVNYLKQLAVKGKIAQAIDWIEDVIQTDKLVVFCYYHETVDALMNHFKKRAVRLTGKESQTQRQKAIDGFQTNPKIKLFVGNIKAAGVAITLTAAFHVAFVELGWTPSDHDQAEDRVHRIGQTKGVNVYYLIANNTIEEAIIDLLDFKRRVITQIMDGKKPKSESILSNLLKKYKKWKENQSAEMFESSL